MRNITTTLPFFFMNHLSQCTNYHYLRLAFILFLSNCFLNFYLFMYILFIYLLIYVSIYSHLFAEFTENNYLLPRPVSDTYLIPPAARPIDPHAVPVSSPTNVELPSFLPSYENFKPGSICTWSATSPTTPSSSSSFAPPAGLENYEVPRKCRSCTSHTPPHSPLERKFEGYLDMHSTGNQFHPNFGLAPRRCHILEMKIFNFAGNDSCTFGSLSSFGASSDFPDTFGCHDKSELYKNIFGLPESQPSSKYGKILCAHLWVRFQS